MRHHRRYEKAHRMRRRRRIDPTHKEGVGTYVERVNRNLPEIRTQSLNGDIAEVTTFHPCRPRLKPLADVMARPRPDVQDGQLSAAKLPFPEQTTKHLAADSIHPLIVRAP